ncbi:hypothetical protein F8388_018765 [Cannabis sativa]|uniref:Uncharacterized protein n=1 Tax=Cannabis sativa TaxID=3483 RepID=A0A7J6GMA8_CANSA|nr:hypothetical protein F8388_018765 [Cannabis sativa]
MEKQLVVLTLGSQIIVYQSGEEITMCQSQCSLINKWFMKIIHRESDYTGHQVTTENLYAVLLGDKKAVKGGSGKVIDSKPNDIGSSYTTQIKEALEFLAFGLVKSKLDHCYQLHAVFVGMPNMPFLYGMDFIEVLKKKHAARTYRKMVIYVEPCESGSIFEGIMPKDMNIYVTTASNAQENSWGTYCPEMEPPPPPEYITCLEDLYSVAWMEDSQGHNLKRETIKQQYEMVKERTANANDFVNGGSHKYKSREALSLPKGFDPATVNFPPNNNKLRMAMEVVNQRDAAILLDLLMCALKNVTQYL